MSDLTPPIKVNAKVILDGLKISEATTKALQQTFAEIRAELPPRLRRLTIGRLTIIWKRR